MHRIRGVAKSKINSGLDEELNVKIMERRSVEREKVLEKRMKNPLTYPMRNETMRD